MGEDRIVKFYARVDARSISLVSCDDKLSPVGVVTVT